MRLLLATTGAVCRHLHICRCVAQAFLTRAEREAEDEALLALHARDPARRPHILSFRPAAGSPVPARLERDIAVVRGGLEAGRAAVHDLLDQAAWC